MISKTVCALTFDNVTFCYRNQDIFRDFSLQVFGDQFVGLIGVNGSGKSTFLKLILGHLHPQKGQVSILGKKPNHFSLRKTLGAALQDIDFPSNEKVVEILSFVKSQFQDSEDLEALISDFFLQEFRHKSCGQLSGGMKRRLALACALVGKPQVLLLDEPTTGLDLPSRLRLIENLKKYQQKNQALVLMISHHPQEILNDVDQFFHLKNGVIKILTPQEMTDLTQLKKVSFSSSQAFPWPGAMKQQQQGEQHWVVCEDSDQLVQQMIKKDFNFKNLLIENLGTQEILQEIL